MKHILVRHAETDGNRRNRHVMGKLGFPLNDTGLKSAHKLRIKLEEINTDFSQPVAVSELLRTQQTAKDAGFTNFVIYPILNEIETDNVQKMIELLAQKKLPKEAKIRTKKILLNPPKELFWFTHGLVISGLIDELHGKNRFDSIPDFAAMIEIDL